MLRRMTQALREQDWTTILIEFVLLVSGVFLGIQAANWNEAHNDQVRARGYLERIGDDLDADIAGYRSRMALWREFSAHGALALAYAEQRAADPATSWQRLLAFYQASTVAAPTLNQATYDELRSAGELRLLAGTRLRTALSNYYAAGVPPVATERPAYRVSIRERIPLELQQYIWANCYIPDGLNLRPIPCASPMDEDKAAAIVAALASDTELLGELRYWMSALEVARVASEGRIQAAKALHQSIDGKLGDAATEAAP